MNENNQIKVVFHTLKKHYTIREKVVPSFTIYGFVPSSTSDWIGIFNSTDSSVDNVFSWKYISTLNLEEDSDTDFTSSVNLDVSFTPVQDISYELRYISDKKTYGRSATFQISAIAPKESFIAVKEGASFDEDLILVDKISYGGK